MKINNRIVMGSALSVAAFLVALDHTKNPVPEVKTSGSIFSSMQTSEGNPCSLEPSPCSLNDDKSPCSL